MFYSQNNAETYTWHQLEEVIDMSPLTKKGEKILEELRKSYGKKKGEGIFYAMENKGDIKGVVKKKRKKKSGK